MSDICPNSIQSGLLFKKHPVMLNHFIYILKHWLYWFMSKHLMDEWMMHMMKISKFNKNFYNFSLYLGSIPYISAYENTRTINYRKYIFQETFLVLYIFKKTFLLCKINKMHRTYIFTSNINNICRVKNLEIWGLVLQTPKP